LFPEGIGILRALEEFGERFKIQIRLVIHRRFELEIAFRR
jgi:hypothetical protein